MRSLPCGPPLEGEDVDDITAKSQTVAEASMKLGQAMYEASQAEAAQADAQADVAKDSDVVDADFEELDERRQEEVCLSGRQCS